jgi:hypothetical protein
MLISSHELGFVGTHLSGSARRGGQNNQGPQLTTIGIFSSCGAARTARHHSGLLPAPPGWRMVLLYCSSRLAGMSRCTPGHFSVPTTQYYALSWGAPDSCCQLVQPPPPAPVPRSLSSQALDLRPEVHMCVDLHAGRQRSLGAETVSTDPDRA